jgi:hypothetical protein
MFAGGARRTGVCPIKRRHWTERVRNLDDFAGLDELDGIEHDLALRDIASPALVAGSSL